MQRQPSSKSAQVACDHFQQRDASRAAGLYRPGFNMAKVSAFIVEVPKSCAVARGFALASATHNAIAHSRADNHIGPVVRHLISK